MNIHECLEQLDRVKKSGGGYTARCPAHEDKRNSLSIKEGDDGRVLVKCFAGCTVEDIVAAKGWKLADLFPQNGTQASGRGKPADPTPKSDRTFEATDADVERIQCALIDSTECLRYIEGRGISLMVAVDLKWGYTEWKFSEFPEAVPALAVPHYVDGKLVGIKYRTIDGSKCFSQNYGSKLDGLYGAEGLDPKAEEILIFEGPEDAALAITHGFNATAINSATSTKLSKSDVELLCQYRRVYLVGDQDPHGQKAMNDLQQRLPAERVIRVRMPAYKDIGELWKADPDNFAVKFRTILRTAQGSCIVHFDLPDILNETEIPKGFDVEKYAINKLAPRFAISMFYGEEKGGKSLLTRYVGKCVANGVKVFGKYATAKMPVLVLDLENGHNDIADFSKAFERVGPELLRYFTRVTGCPPLDSPALLRLCEKHQPLIIIDSMTKFLNGVDPFHPGEMSVFFDKLLNLCTAGATIIIVHHAVRADVERYADSHQIGANIARAFCVVSLDRPKLHRVRMEGQLFRGSEPVTEHLIGFPIIDQHGCFGLATPDENFSSDEFDHLNAFVADFKIKNERPPTREEIKKGLKMKRTKAANLVNAAIEAGVLAKVEGGFWDLTKPYQTPEKVPENESEVLDAAISKKMDSTLGELEEITSIDRNRIEKVARSVGWRRREDGWWVGVARS